MCFLLCCQWHLGSLAVSLGGWLDGWLASWLASSLAGWLAGWQSILYIHISYKLQVRRIQPIENNEKQDAARIHIVTRLKQRLELKCMRRGERRSKARGKGQRTLQNPLVPAFDRVILQLQENLLPITIRNVKRSTVATVCVYVC